MNEFDIHENTRPGFLAIFMKLKIKKCKKSEKESFILLHRSIPNCFSHEWIKNVTFHLIIDLKNIVKLWCAKIFQSRMNTLFFNMKGLINGEREIKRTSLSEMSILDERSWNILDCTLDKFDVVKKQFPPAVDRRRKSFVVIDRLSHVYFDIKALQSFISIHPWLFFKIFSSIYKCMWKATNWFFPLGKVIK